MTILCQDHCRVKWVDPVTLWEEGACLSWIQLFEPRKYKYRPIAYNAELCSYFDIYISKGNFSLLVGSVQRSITSFYISSKGKLLLL